MTTKLRFLDHYKSNLEVRTQQNPTDHGLKLQLQPVVLVLSNIGSYNCGRSLTNNTTFCNHYDFFKGKFTSEK